MGSGRLTRGLPEHPASLPCLIHRPEIRHPKCCRPGSCDPSLLVSDLAWLYPFMTRSLLVQNGGLVPRHSQAQPRGHPQAPLPQAVEQESPQRRQGAGSEPKTPQDQPLGTQDREFPAHSQASRTSPMAGQLLWTAGRRAILTVLTQPLPPGAHVWPAVPGPSAHGWPCSKGLWPGPASALLSFPLWAPRPLPPLRPCATGRGSGPSLPSLTENCGCPLQVGQGGGPEGQRPRHRLPSIPGEVRSWGLSQDPRRGRAKG